MITVLELSTEVKLKYKLCTNPKPGKTAWIRNQNRKIPFKILVKAYSDESGSVSIAIRRLEVVFTHSLKSGLSHTYHSNFFHSNKKFNMVNMTGVRKYSAAFLHSQKLR